MCGIAGIVSLAPGLDPAPLEAIARMVGALRHRGPDESGVYRDPRAALGHARLSIIDLATGQQPLANEDGTLWVVFNGEIFNYVELRAELETLGHRFATRSDTEVIVHAFESWGEEAFARFNGQWALALWDRREERLVLARDPLGVRPLHWTEHGGRIWFASEVKAIFAAERGIRRALDPRGLAETFTFWAPVAPRTVFEGVNEVEPGHVRVWHEGQVRDRAIWHPLFPARGASRFAAADGGEAAAATRDALERATSLRMLRADVPVGSYLSGGLDSSLIAALALRARGGRFATFSLCFDDAEYDEAAWQRRMAAHLGSEHHEIAISRADIAGVFPEVIVHAERPLLRTAPAPMYLLSRLVRQGGTKVVLTGEGADEMFAGYDLFREARLRRFWARAPHSHARPRLLGRLYPWLTRSPATQGGMTRRFFGQDLERWRSPGFGHGPRWRSTASLQRLFAAPLRAALAGFDPVASLLATAPADLPGWSPLAQDQYFELRTLLSGYLLSAQGDRMLMAHSVEGRFPFLDRNVVALALALPDRYKLDGLDEKAVLRRVADGLLPPEILARRKQPYRAPDALSFVGADAPEWVGEMLSPGALAAAGVFDCDLARRLHAKCVARRDEGQLSNADNMALVGVLSTQLLHASLVASAEAAAPASFSTTIDRLGRIAA